MDKITELHEKAMEATDLAFRAKRKGDLEQAESLFRQAFEFEAKAAMLVPQDASHAITRAVLYRSAATLACDCKEYREAERLIGAGLASSPPEAIATELRELYEQLLGHLKSQPAENEKITETITGKLRYADDVSPKRTIKLIDEQGHLRDIVVPNEMMPRIIKPLWGEMVTVIGVHHGSDILLEEIRLATV